jgi:hypothetical protein
MGSLITSKAKWPFIKRPRLLLYAGPLTITSGGVAFREAHSHPTNFTFMVQAKNDQQMHPVTESITPLDMPD